MILHPSYEGSPDVECGKTTRRTYFGTPCCEDCLAAIDEQERVDAEKRRARETGSAER